MFWRRDRATLDDVVEWLRGVGMMLQELDAKLQRIVSLLEEGRNGGT